jgi:hypothetical protein
MADITLAECNGRIWLVSDERWLDDLLNGTLPTDVSYEIVACDSMPAVLELWRQNCDPPEFTPNPWIIHPGIVDRLRRSGPGYSVYFAQWSALLDDEAATVIGAAANWAIENPEAPVVLTAFVDADGPKAIADLAALRCQLAEDALAEKGVGRDRMSRATRPVSEGQGVGQESQRVDIVIRATPP